MFNSSDGGGSERRAGGKLLDRIKKFDENSKTNPHFKSANIKNNLVDLVAKEDLEIKIDFDALDRKYGISDDEGDGGGWRSCPDESEMRRAHSADEYGSKPRRGRRKQAPPLSDEQMGDGPYLPAPEGTPKPGDTLKADPLGSLEFPFNDVYKLGDELNSGAFGTVYKGYHIMTGPKGEVAIKVVDREAVNDNVSDEEIMRETQVMKELREVEHIVRLFDFYMDDEKFYVVQELAGGGDVFDKLAECKAYTESDARDLCKILLETISKLHDIKLLHRDLKPENLLLKNVKTDTGILLCDFGFAKYIPNKGNGTLSTHCGTPQYASPEIVNGEEYRYEVDMWAIGCIIFMLLSGLHPFAAADDTETYQLISAGDWAFGYNDAEKDVWNKISPEAKDLITNLFHMDGTKRLRAFEALEHKWFTDCAKFKLKKTKLESVTVANIKKYNETVKKPGKFAYVDKHYVGDVDCLYVGPSKEELARLKKLRAIALYRPDGHHLD